MRRCRRGVVAVIAVMTTMVAGASLPVAADGRGARPAAKQSSPFSVGPTPTGYEMLTAGIGTQGQDWGDDSFGNDEPFTVLAPVGESATSRHVVVVSITGFAGYQGGLGQASAGYISPEARSFTVAGRDAIYTAAGSRGTDRRWADLVVDRGDDIAVRVTSPTASRQELVDLERRVRITDDHARAPRVPDPPDGLRVVGSTDVDVVLALSSWVSEREPGIPGGPSGHGVAWSAGEGRGLAVMTVRGGSATLDALRSLPALPEWRSSVVRPLRVDGRNGVVVERVPEEGRYRAVALESSWGDLVVVTAMREDVPSEGELLDVARSVRRVDDGTWARFVEQATGNTPLSPDADAIELARGSVGDLEWLFQARPSDSLSASSFPGGGGDVMVGDPCLKLSNRHRICADSGGLGGTTESITYSRSASGNEYGFPAFVVVTSRTGGASLRIQTKSGTGTGPLHELPGGHWTGLVFVDGGALAGCAPFTADTPASFMRVAVLDGGGNETACLGLQPSR